MGLAFAHLNLRRNPFGELLSTEAAAVAIVDLGDAPVWLAAPGRALQVLGAPGRGKTTWLRALHARLPAAAWLRPDEEGRVAPTDAPLVLVDDAQRLSARALRALLGAGRSVALADHADRRRELRRAGLDARTIHLQGLDEPTLRLAVARRVEAVRRRPGPVPALGDDLRALLGRHGGDVRAIVGELYDKVQELDRVGL